MKLLQVVVIVATLFFSSTFLFIADSKLYKNISYIGTNDWGIPEELASKDRRIMELESQLAALSQSAKKTMTLVIFAFTGDLDFNTEFFLRHGVFESDSVDFVLVRNGGDYFDADDIYKNTDGQPSNLHYFLKPENEGWDFCMFKTVLDIYLKKKNYSHLIILNRTVRGPFLPSYFKGTWIDAVLNMFNDRIAVAGITANCLDRSTNSNMPSPLSEYPSIHLQSMFLAMDARAIKVYSENTRCINDKIETINVNEIGATKWFLLDANVSFIPMAQLWKGVNMDDGDDVVERCNRINSDPWSGDSDGHMDGIHIHPLETIFIKTNRFVTKEMDKLAEWQDMVWKKKRRKQSPT